MGGPSSFCAIIQILDLRDIRTWSILQGSPSRRRASAGTMSPNLMLIMSPGTRISASCSDHLPSRRTCARVETNQNRGQMKPVEVSLVWRFEERWIQCWAWRIATFVFGASLAISEAAALPALFSSMKLMVELITNSVKIPIKSCQSGGFPCKMWIAHFHQQIISRCSTNETLHNDDKSSHHTCVIRKAAWVMKFYAPRHLPRL